MDKIDPHGDDVPDNIVLLNEEFWARLTVRRSLINEDGTQKMSLKEINAWARENYPFIDGDKLFKD